MILGFVTKNEGKYQSMKKLLEGKHIVKKLVWINNVNGIIEGDNSLYNANLKSVEGSKLTDIPVLATDESLFLDFLPDNEQPGAYVKRVIGDNPSDLEFISFYSELISKQLDSEGRGKIITAFSVSQKGVVLSEMKYDQVCIFKVPPSDVVLKGRPLASLHYFDKYKAFYSELTDEQKNEINDEFNNKIICFLNSLTE